MTPLLDALYQYVMENEMFPYIDKKKYDEDFENSQFHKTALESTLTEVQKDHLDGFIQAFDTLEYMQAEAIFRAALSVGLTLGALPRQ